MSYYTEQTALLWKHLSLNKLFVSPRMFNMIAWQIHILSFLWKKCVEGTDNFVTGKIRFTALHIQVSESGDWLWHDCRVNDVKAIIQYDWYLSTGRAGTMSNSVFSSDVLEV